MDPFLVIFVLFSPLWWVLFLVSSGLIIWALEEDNGVWATVVLVAAILLSTFFGTMPTLTWFQQNQWTLLSLVVGYFIVGSLWGYGFKWYFFCVSKLEKYEEVKRHWLRDKGRPDSKNVPDDLKDKWSGYLLSSSSDFATGYGDSRTIQIQPRYWDHKARTLRWAIYWPWSMLWSIFDDIIRNVFRHLQRFFSGVMEWISNFVFRNLDDDFVKTDPAPPVDSSQDV